MKKKKKKKKIKKTLKKILNEYFRVYLSRDCLEDRPNPRWTQRSRGQRQRSSPRRANGSGKLVRTEIFY